MCNVHLVLVAETARSDAASWASDAEELWNARMVIQEEQ